MAWGDRHERPGDGSARSPGPGRAVLVVGRGAVDDGRLRRSMAADLAVLEVVEDFAAAERLLPRCHFDLVIVECPSEHHAAIAWIATLRDSADPPRIVATGENRPALESAALGAGAQDFLPLPLDARSLRRLLDDAAGDRARARPLAPQVRRGARRPATELIGDSAAISRVREIVRRVAPTPATVLIEGQTGTGKELVARLLHSESGRRGPFVPVNCGAIPPELMESELFGHSKGAFTGAHQLREGLFVAARGGTLFLDEVSEMRGDLQVKLLRVLEEGAIRPVGTDRELPIDVRIVASAQPGLREGVRNRSFREDLYYRLNVVHIALPGLRERSEDIPALVEYLMGRVAEEFGMDPVRLDDSQLARLCRRPWPGNVRELRNLVERTILMGSLPQTEIPEAGAETGLDANPAGYPIEWTLEQVKQAHIARVLASQGGNRTAAARQLGVSRKTLERRLGPGGPRPADPD
ncbi:MAG TPA: sigma-54 dependent transcriptional regulator [Steroidobacteraceae bacterium]|nr:sigma-54 dependent transcriptional regulator [Steroidobacteraceae bacterium]